MSLRRTRLHKDKQPFQDLAGAQRVADDMAKLNGVAYKAYACPFCGAFHVAKA